MPHRLTTEEFIEKAKAVHGDRYDYSQVEYEGSKKPITIACLEHGLFNQIPNAHLNDQGCPDCAGTGKLTAETFIRKARAIHGDRYDYSQVEYLNSKTKVRIICPGHGTFEATPNNHVSRKSGCPTCALATRADSMRRTKDEFVKRAREAHGDRYDYSRVEYVDGHKKVAIICPEHGPFRQTPNSHSRLGRGCPHCGGTKRLAEDSFIRRARTTHGDRFDYSQVRYLNSQTKVRLICPEHGPFAQNPNSHLRGAGCPDCSGKKQRTTETFTSRAREVHGEQYDYSSVNYVTAHTKVTIICPEHGPFEQKPSDHLNSRAGCPDCARTGFNPSEPGMLYYIAIATDGEGTLYKIGITNTSVEDRFRAPDLSRIRVVKTWRYFSGRRAVEREAEILRQYAGDKYYGPDVLVGPGNSELFTHDILALDRPNEESG